MNSLFRKKRNRRWFQALSGHFAILAVAGGAFTLPIAPHVSVDKITLPSKVIGSQINYTVVNASNSDLDTYRLNGVFSADTLELISINPENPTATIIPGSIIRRSEPFSFGSFILPTRSFHAHEKLATFVFRVKAKGKNWISFSKDTHGFKAGEEVNILSPKP